MNVIKDLNSKALLHGELINNYESKTIDKSTTINTVPNKEPLVNTLVSFEN